MSTKVSNLTKAVVKNYPDFNIREDLDYVEDGKKTYGYDYKGLLPITTMRTQDVTYLDIDFFKYVDSHDFNFVSEDIPNSVYSASNKFSQVSEIDMEDLIDTCEFIIRTLNELNEKALEDHLDMRRVEARIDTELSILFELKSSMEKLHWWKIKESDIKAVHGAFNSALKAIDELLVMKRNLGNKWWCSIKEKRETYYHVEKYGYIKITFDSAVLKTLMRAISTI